MNTIFHPTEKTREHATALYYAKIEKNRKKENLNKRTSLFPDFQRNPKNCVFFFCPLF